MTDYTVGAALPRHHYGIHWRSATAITVCKDSDLAAPDANVLAMPSAPVKVLNSGPVSVEPEFFGIHVTTRSNDAAVSALTCKTVRSHDMSNGKGRWKYIETANDVWDFTDLDAWVNTHYAAGRDMVFTLYGTPTIDANYSARPTEEGVYGPSNLGTQAEPADMTKWDRFCAKIATRYLGKIKYYEVWNEPNRYNDGTGPTAAGVTNKRFFFSGTFAKLSEMTRRANIAIKAVDPAAKIISSPITDWVTTANGAQETYFTGMMSAPSGDGSTTMKDWIDIVGVHLYLSANTCASLGGMIDRVNAAKTTAGVSGKETWDTESAPNEVKPNVMSDLQMRKYLTRFLITLAAKGIKRHMYYTYDSSLFGFNGRADVEAYWNQLRTFLMSGEILKVSQLSDGRIVYTTSGGQYIV